MEETGEWYLPDSEIKIPGKLITDDNAKKIFLKLYTPITFSGKELKVNKRIDKNGEDAYYEKIIGNRLSSVTARYITLYSCSFKNCPIISDKLYELTYQVQFVFNYVHLKNLLFKSVSIDFPFLKTFYDGWEDEFDELQEKEPEEYRKYGNVIDINSNFSIKTVDLKWKQLKKRKGYEIKYSKHLEFHYKESVDIESVYKDCNYFTNILEFTTRKKLSFIIKDASIELRNTIGNYNTSILVNDKDESRDYTYTSITSVLNFQKEPFLDRFGWTQGYMIFSRWTESQEELNRIIKKWFNNEKLMPIYDFYIDSYNWFKGKVTLSNVMYNNKFLNLIQALEGYYDYLDPIYINTNEMFVGERQKVINSLNDSHLKTWVMLNSKYPKQPTIASKLKHLCDKFNKILNPLFIGHTYIDDYPASAKEYRNKLSHGKINTTYQGPELEGLFKFSQLLLCICIMNSLEMTKYKIIERINANPDLFRIPRFLTKE